MSDSYLEIKNVDFTIGGKIKVKNASFAIENEGDTLCILGPSGIGKTTILRTIAGLEKIDKGSIKLNGKLLSSKDKNIEPEDRNTSLAFQDNSLFPHYTVEKNILLGAERNKGKKDKKISLKEIVDLLDIFHILNKYPHQISAGEAQRASLARSLITQPDLLLLDEPLSNVDQSFKEEIQEKLKLKFNTIYDEKDAVGRRYRRQDAIGTPYCVTVDHQTLEDNSVTIRHRDTMKQERISIDKIEKFLSSSLDINNWLLNSA